MDDLIPIFTQGFINNPSVRILPNPDITYISSFTGKILDKHPTYNTKTDDPTGEYDTYKVGILSDNNIVICYGFDRK